MDDREREHPDEGTIHAWLDGALDDDAARAVAEHVASCPACAERVAEARGLIAGASRIVSALDDAPSTSAPAWGQAPAAPAGAAPRRPAWRMLRVTPARAAIAATVLVALGVSLTYERTAVESQASRADSGAPGAMSTFPASPAQPAPQAGSQAAPRRDALLDSAVARNLAAAQPPRAVKAAPAPATGAPVPMLVPESAIADRAAPARVAAARGAFRAQRDSGAGLAADQLARPGDASARAAERTVAAAARADSAGMASMSMVNPAAGAPAAGSRVLRMAPGPECYRVESANGIAATWGVDALPLVVRVDSAHRGVVVLTVAGQPTGSTALITRAGDDSLLLRLRRIGFEGTLALGAPGDARAGVMRSRPLQTQLEEVVAGAAPEAPAPARRTPTRAPMAKAAPAPAPAAAAEARRAADAAPAVPVVARRIGCPG